MTYRTLHRMVNVFNYRDGDAAELEKLIDDEVCTEDTALLAFWKLEGPWHYADEKLEAHPQGALIKKLRDRILEGHYPKSDIDYNPSFANKLSLTQVQKLQNAGLPDVFLRLNN